MKVINIAKKLSNMEKLTSKIKVTAKINKKTDNIKIVGQMKTYLTI